MHAIHSYNSYNDVNNVSIHNIIILTIYVHNKLLSIIHCTCVITSNTANLYRTSEFNLNLSKY